VDTIPEFFCFFLCFNEMCGLGYRDVRGVRGGERTEEDKEREKICTVP
jgi:hypothetical protein